MTFLPFWLEAKKDFNESGVDNGILENLRKGYIKYWERDGENGVTCELTEKGRRLKRDRLS